MSLAKAPFQNYKSQEERDQEKGKVFTIRLNDEEIKNLRSAQVLLQQEKQSTTIKQLAMFGLSVLHERSTAYLIKVLGDNLRKNKRLGIHEVEVSR